MKILILGAGQVGGSLATNLSSDGYEVTVVDEDSDKLANLDDSVDLRTVLGHASHPLTLRKAGCDKDTVLLSLTNNDEVNLIASKIAKSSFNAKKTICRLNDSSYITEKNLIDDFVDIPISPENDITEHLFQLITHPGTNQIEDFADGKVKLVSVKAQKNGNLVGQELKVIRQDMPGIDTFVPIIYRKGKPIKAKGSTIIKENDEIYFITAAENIDEVVNEVQEKSERFSRVFIIGGGKIGFNLAKQLEKKFNVKVVERDKSRCKFLSEELNKAIVLHGSGSDESLLISENISQTDVFCSLTNDDEANIMSAFLAKKLGAKKTMILVNNISYMDIIPKRFIDNVIAPYRLTISLVMQDLREGDFAQEVILKMHTGAEAIEGVIHPNSSTAEFIGSPINSLPLPDEATLGAVVRSEEVLMPSDDLKLQIEDHLIVFLTNKSAVSEVEKYFKEV